MIKKTLIGLLFLGASYMTRAQEISPCEIVYREAPLEPGCPPGSGDAICDEGPMPAIYQFVAIPGRNSFTEPNLRVKSFQFNGDCECSITLYSEENLAGCTKTVKTDTTGYDWLEVSDVWKKNTWPASLAVTCKADFELPPDLE